MTLAGRNTIPALCTITGSTDDATDRYVHNQFSEVTFLIRTFRGCVPGWPYPANEKHFYSLVTFSRKMT